MSSNGEVASWRLTMIKDIGQVKYQTNHGAGKEIIFL